MATTEDIIINIDVEGAKGSADAIQGVTKSLDDNAKASDDAAEGVEDYNSSLSESIKDTKIFGVSLNSVSKAFKSTLIQIKSVNTGLKLFKVALLATGIGLFVVALTTLISTLTKTQGGMDLVTKATNAIGAAFDAVIDRFIRFGEGFIKFVTGDFKAGFDEMKTSFSGIGAQIRDTVEASNDLSDAFAELETQKINNIVADAKARAEGEALKAIYEDTTKSLNERITAAKAFQTVEAERSAQAIAIATEELRILKERNSLATSTNEDLRAEAEAEAELFRLREESGARQLSEATKLRALQAEQSAARVDEVIITGAEIERAEYESQANITKFTKEQIAERMKANAAYNADLAAKRAQDLANAQAAAEAEAQLTADLLGSIASLLGQESEAGKAFAIAQAFINMYLAISKANTLVPPASYIAMGIAAANGLKAVRDIQAQPLPKVTIAATPFARGGAINGPGHRGGGVWLNAEGGEYIINKSAMRDPINRAIVESINQGQSKGIEYAQGGFITPNSLELFNIESAIMKARPVLILPDLNAAQANVIVSESISTLSDR